LLAGTFGGTLLASAYKTSEHVTAATTKITYELKALNVAVNGPTNKAQFTDPELPSPSGNTKDGFPYFVLPTGSVSIGTITIGNFPDAAILPGSFAGDTTKDDFYKDDSPPTGVLPALATFGELDLVRLLTAYTTATAKAGEFGTAAEGNVSGSSPLTDAAAYTAAAQGAAAAYEEAADLLSQLNTGAPATAIGTLRTALTAVSGGSLFGNVAANAAWVTANSAFSATTLTPDFTATGSDWSDLIDQLKAAGVAYTNAADAVAAGTATKSDDAVIAAATTAKGNVDLTSVEYPPVQKLREAFAAANNAIAVTSGLTMGSLGVASTGNQPPVVLPFAGGFVSASGGTGTVTFVLGTPGISGLSKLYFDFAFKPFGSSAANTWHIKEGLDNYLVDNGKAEGGSILLSIGSAPSGIIIIGNGPTQ
jgi:hypothetical protein